jgi:hypothetical protein
MATNQEQMKTREEYRKTIDVEKDKVAVVHPKVRVRFFPIWMRLVFVVVLAVIFLMVGAAVGYGVLGGGKPTDVFKQATWTHIADLVNKE